jgi:hypothetical protein
MCAGNRKTQIFFAFARGFGATEILLTATSPQHNFSVMTGHPCSGSLGIVMNGLVHANAFVVQFRSAAGASEEQFSGRVEHVASGRTATFHSMEELPKLLLKMLQDFRAGEWATSD